jgi:hypothetical protein
VALVAGALLAGASAAWLLNWLFQRQWYLLILVPAVAALLVGLLIARLVAITNCRQPISAALVGALAGLIMYLGQYHFAMLEQLPPGNVHRLDLLPRFILFRLQTGVEQKLGPQAPNAPPPRPSINSNSVRFGIEVILCVVFSATVAWRRASRPWYAKPGQWAAREEKRLPVGTQALFEQAVETQTLDEFVRGAHRDIAGQKKAATARTYATCELFYLRHPGISPRERPVYLTFINNAANPIEMLRRRGPLRLVELEDAEVESLRPLFPNLDRILSGFPAQGAVRAETPATIDAEKEARRSVPQQGAVIAEVPGGGTLISRPFLLCVNLLGLIPLVTFFGGLALVAAGVWGLWRGWSGGTALGCIVVGLGSFTLGAIHGTKYTGLLEAWYARSRLLRTLERRPDTVVDLHGEGAEPLMVNFTRRENWLAVKLDVRDDAGLLTIDERRREVRIEGDKRRYVIPFASVHECRPECFHHPLDKQLLNQYWYVRLLVLVDGEERELLFSPTFTDWRPRTNENRRLAAEELCGRIAPAPDLPA